MHDAVRYIVNHLDAPIDLGELADHVCMSRFHFHRVFQALLGETVGEMARRFRLERAAVQLRCSETSITDLAFEAGYATHEAFIRAFRSAFECTPSEMRKRIRYEGRLPTPNGTHFDAVDDLRFVSLQGAIHMDIDIRAVPTRKAVCMAHSGPYFMIGQTFGKLGAWLQQNPDSYGQCLALFYDDPESTPADKLRSDAGAIVPDSYTTNDPHVHVVEVAGGSYAVTTFKGPYSGLSAAWGDFAKCPLPEGYTYRNTPPFEVYVQMDEEVGGPKSVTELYLAVQAEG